jgi:hypothetical protein
MVELSLEAGSLILKVKGLDRLWAFRSRLEIPLAHIKGVRADPSVAMGWRRGIRAAGTHVPGVLVAGTFYQDGKRVFWDVHRADKTIVFDLDDDRYDQLIVEVADPARAVERVRNALAGT